MPACIEVDFGHYILPSHDIKAEHDKVYMTLKPPVNMSDAIMIIVICYLEEFLSISLIQSIRDMGRCRLSSRCFPDPQGNIVGKAEVK